MVHLTFLGVPVSCFQVPFPEKPLSDSEEDTKTWRREASKVKRINSERHSRRCDTELKLAVISQPLTSILVYGLPSRHVDDTKMCMYLGWENIVVG